MVGLGFDAAMAMEEQTVCHVRACRAGAPRLRRDAARCGSVGQG